MSTEQLRQFTCAQPFAPFRIHLTDGQRFDISQPGLVIVTRHVVYIGIHDPVANVTDRVLSIAMSHVAGAELLGE